MIDCIPNWGSHRRHDVSRHGPLAPWRGGLVTGLNGAGHKPGRLLARSSRGPATPGGHLRLAPRPGWPSTAGTEIQVRSFTGEWASEPIDAERMPWNASEWRCLLPMKPFDRFISILRSTGLRWRKKRTNLNGDLRTRKNRRDSLPTILCSLFRLGPRPVAKTRAHPAKMKRRARGAPAGISRPGAFFEAASAHARAEADSTG